MSFTSKVIISSDFEAIKDEMIANFGEKSLRFIPKSPASEFLLDEARAVLKESYIAENSEKIIIIMAESFRTEAQNFLLKLFEEPPRNIKFLIVSPSKNLLLPTIRSRFIFEKRGAKKKILPLNFDLLKLDLKGILEVLSANENLEKSELLDFIASLSYEAVRKYDLSEAELEFFYKAYELARLNTKASILLSTLLLSLYQKNHK